MFSQTLKFCKIWLLLSYGPLKKSTEVWKKGGWKSRALWLADLSMKVCKQMCHISYHNVAATAERVREILKPYLYFLTVESALHTGQSLHTEYAKSRRL